MTARPAVEPPRIAELLLKASLPPGEAARAILGDLREELVVIAAERGRVKARLWYWRQALDVGGRYLVAARRPPRRPRPERGDGLLRSLAEDARFAGRSARRSPAFGLAVAATLAVGLGAATALFAVLEHVVLKPLPYPGGDRIVSVSEDNPDIDMPVGFTSLPNYLDWRRDNDVFDALGLFRGRSMSITGGGMAEYVYGAFATPDFFETFGVAPSLGRLFTEEEIVPGRDGVALLAHGSWQRLFGGVETILGQTILVDGRPRTVVGVMPPGFNAPAGWIAPNLAMDLWVPFPVTAEADSSPQARNNRSYSVVGRLRDGVGIERATTAMEAIHARLRLEHPEANEAWTIQLVPWHEMVVGRVERALYVLFGAASLLLLIACANVSSLELNHNLARRDELAMRVALGAGKLRLLRQMLIESGWRAAVGGILGLALARAAVAALAATHPGDLPRLAEIGISPAVVGVAATLTLASVLASALVPALQAMRGDLRLSSRSPSHRLRSGVIALELAVSVVLLIGAGLLTRSFFNLTAVDPGLDPRGVLTATVALSWDRVTTLPERSAYVRDVLDRLETLPGVERVAMINSLPLSGSNQFQAVTIEGAPSLDPSRRPAVALRGISPGYLDVMGIPLVEGRDIDERDLERADAVLVNRTAAKVHWPDGALGRRVAIGDDDQWLTIVGVVEDVRHWGLKANLIPEIYQGYTAETLTSKSFVLRAADGTDPESLAPATRVALLAADPDQPIRDLRPMQAYVDGSLAPARFQSLLMLVASAAALALAGFGLYSVMAVSVTERRHEIGVRLALGAERITVVRIFLERALALACYGGGLGLLAAYGLSRFVASLLFGISALDASTYLLASMGVVFVALAASVLPALRASGLDPLAALRSE